MSVLVTYPDVQAAGITLLSDALAGRTEPYAQNVTVRSYSPYDSGDVPVVQVTKDSDSTTYPIISRSTLRITVWHESAADAHDLGSLCQGLLLAHDGSTIEATQSLTGPIPGVDRDLGLDYSTFTVAATMHATVVT